MSEVRSWLWLCLHSLSQKLWNIDYDDEREGIIKVTWDLYLHCIQLNFRTLAFLKIHNDPMKVD